MPSTTDANFVLIGTRLRMRIGLTTRHLTRKLVNAINFF